MLTSDQKQREGGLGSGLSQPSGSPIKLQIVSVVPVLSHLGRVGYKGGKGLKKEESNTLFLLTSGVSSANVMRESSCKGYEAKGKSLTKYGAGPKNRDEMEGKN